MDDSVFLDRVMRWGAIKRRREAERAAFATLRALRELLMADEADALARELTPHLARILRGGADGSPFGAKEFYTRASRYENVQLPFAMEHAQAVCQALASVLTPSSIARLSRAVPELAPLFVVPDRDSHPATVLSPDVRSIAEARPGSKHPLSEGHPFGRG
jgi:uncharacterized protein (DUF2267 family)